MARGIEIPLIADVSRFVKGMGDAEQSVEDLSDVFDDTSRAADDAGDKIDDAMTAAGREADDAADKVERSWKDALGELQDRSRKAGDDLGDNIRRGARRGEDGVNELRDEANQSAREAGASFTGEFEDVADYLQEVAANALGGFGPAGAAAGLAAAAGIGIALQKLTEVSEKTNEAKEEAAELAREFATADTAEQVDLLNGRLDDLVSQITDVRSVWEVWQADAVTFAEELADAMPYATESLRRFFDVAGNENASAADLADVVRDLEQQYSDLDDQLVGSGRQVRGMTDEQRAQREAVEEARAAIGNVIPELEEYAEQQRAIEEQTRILAELEGLTVEQYRARAEAQQRATDAQESYADALESTADPVSTYEGLLEEKNTAEREAAEKTAAATEDTSDSWKDYVDDVKVSTQDLIDEWNRQAEQAEQFEDNLATIAEAGGQALADELRAKGPEVAGATAAVIAEAGPKKQRQAIEAHARATGSDVSESVGAGIRDNAGAVQGAVDDVIGGIQVTDVVVPVYADTSAVNREIDALSGRTISVTANVTGRTGLFLQ